MTTILIILHRGQILEHLQAERIESVKVGILGGLSFCLGYGVFFLVNWAFFPVETNLLPVKLIIALVTGFLFGVTYRYVVRDDQNPFLKDGVVLAFALVRGLAPVEIAHNLTWILLILVIESIFCFTVARFTLDLAFYRNWLKKSQ